MELTDQELEQLEAFYSGTLSSKERLAVEKRMQKERDYGEAARNFLTGIEALERGKIRALRMQIEQEEPVQEPVMKVSWRKWWWAAAAAVVGILFFIQIDKNKQSTSVIFDDHYPRLGNVMGDKDKMTLRDTALNAYEARKYSEGIAGMEQWLKRQPNDDEVKFYLGISYMAVKQMSKAEHLLDQLRYTEIPQKEAILWYLAKCKIELGKNEEAKNLLKIVQARGSRQMIRKADSLINVINKK